MNPDCPPLTTEPEIPAGTRNNIVNLRRDKLTCCRISRRLSMATRRTSHARIRRARVLQLFWISNHDAVHEIRGVTSKELIG
jgi:hypothetical protein